MDTQQNAHQSVAGLEDMTEAQQSAAVLTKWGMTPSPQLQQQLQQEQLQQQRQQAQVQQRQPAHSAAAAQPQAAGATASQAAADLHAVHNQHQPHDGSDALPAEAAAAGDFGLTLEQPDMQTVAAGEMSREGAGIDDSGLTLEQPDGESQPPLVPPEVVRGRVVRATKLWHRQLSQQEAQQQVTHYLVSNLGTEGVFTRAISKHLSSRQHQKESVSYPWMLHSRALDMARLIACISMLRRHCLCLALPGALNYWGKTISHFCSCMQCSAAHVIARG